MDEDQIDKIDEDNDQPLAAPEQVDAEDAEEEVAPPAEGEPDFGQDVISADGKLLGKFENVNTLARSYKEIEKLSGRKASEAAEYKKLLEGQGYTFDAGGKPVAPAAPAPAAGYVPDAPEGGLTPGHRVDANGVEYDHLNMPIIPDELWEQAKEEDPENYMVLRAEHMATRAYRQEQYNDRQGQQQTQAMTARQAEARKVAKDTYGLDDAAITRVEAQVHQTLLAAAPAARNNPDAYALIAKAAAADEIPAIHAAYQQQIDQILAGNKEAIAKGRRVVALERGTVNAPAANTAPAGTLSKEQRLMAKTLGVSEADYAKNL